MKIYGPRNFGKTSLVKNILAPKWESENRDNRIILYADFYSVESLENISIELTKGFNKAISAKKNLFDKGMNWVKSLKNIRPVWQPSTTGDGIGDFSIRTEHNNEIVDFEILFENINNLSCNKKNKKKGLEFLIILDEFQEIAKIKRAEAKLRNALQNLASNIPVIILGSKQHLLSQVFDRPKAPFYSWGYTIELHPIDYEQYNNYLNERFTQINQSIDLETSTYLQNKLNRIPEAINRFCDFIARDSLIANISKEIVDLKIQEFIDKSRSLYENNYTQFNKNPRKVLLALAKARVVSAVTGQKFLKEVPSVSKTGVSDIVKTLLDDSVISRDISSDGEFLYRISDPFLREFLIRYK
ncbi:MAG: ATP-binding protein [Oligoflexia bacterium]|nr:ATP-binding protein [Oligoflexia bacterium]